MKNIRLHNTKKIVALVDDEDYERVRHFKWNLQNKGYIWRFHDNTFTFMHHEILGSDQMISHKDGNKANNQKENLIPVSHGQYRQRGTRKDNKTGFRGVRTIPNGRFVAITQVDDKRKYLGTFETAELAAQAYDKAILERFGPTAHFNFPQ